MILRPASADDFAFIRSLTQNPTYAPFLGDDDETQLAAWCADPACRVLIWGDYAGFAIFREIGNPAGRIELFRLALAQTSQGGASSFLAALITFGFYNLSANKIWLDASGENTRAHRAYLRAGFAVEGVLRQHWYRPTLGHNVDLVLYGMLRPLAAEPPATYI